MVVSGLAEEEEVQGEEVAQCGCHARLRVKRQEEGKRDGE